jgi:hypothetical protein
MLPVGQAVWGPGWRDVGGAPTSASNQVPSSRRARPLTTQTSLAGSDVSALSTDITCVSYHVCMIRVCVCVLMCVWICVCVDVCVNVSELWWVHALVVV